MTQQQSIRKTLEGWEAYIAFLVSRRNCSEAMKAVGERHRKIMLDLLLETQLREFNHD